jgi:PAP2 superfamily.
MSTEIIVFLARDLIWVMAVLTLGVVGFDLWKSTNSKYSILKRIRHANWRKVGFIVLAFLLAFLVAQLFHLLPVEIYRPYQIVMRRPLIIPSTDTPFPSDHVMMAFALALAITFMTRFKKISLIGYALAVCVALGRVLALVHSPLDVFGGILCAVIGAAVWYYLYYRETPRNLPGDLKKLWKKTKSLWATASGKASKIARKVSR